MRFTVLVCLLASTCADEDAAAGCASNSVPEGGDDRCQLLQAGVGVVSHHGGDHRGQLEKSHRAGGSAEAVDKGFPGDLFKKLASAVGGADKLEKDFEAVKTAVATFAHEVHEAIKELTENVKPDASIDAALAQVEAAQEKIHAAALKLWEALKKTSETFMTTVGKVAPEQFKSAMKAILDKLSTEAKSFADSFKDAANELKKVNRTVVCVSVKHHLDAMHKKVEALAKSALGLSTKGMDKEMLKAKDALPDTLKKKIDEILEKANEAAEKLMSSSSSTMQEISMGIAQALKGHCAELSENAAGRLEVGILSALVLGLSAFLM